MFLRGGGETPGATKPLKPGVTVTPAGVTPTPLVELDGSVKLAFSDEEYNKLLADTSKAAPALLRGITGHFQDAVPSAAVTITATDPPAFMGRRLATDVKIEFIVKAPAGPEADQISSSLTLLVDGDTAELTKFVAKLEIELSKESLDVTIEIADVQVTSVAVQGTTAEPEAEETPAPTATPTAAPGETTASPTAKDDSGVFTTAAPTAGGNGT